MLKAISVIENCVPVLGFCSFGNGETAISIEAQTLTDKMYWFISYYQESHALFGKKATVISHLREIARECNNDDWDGEGARATDPIALLNAEDFIRALPNDLSMPECSPETDGAISFEWVRSSYRLFMISIGQSRRISYAWLDGSGKGHGVEFFDGKTLPTRLIQGIQSIL